MRTKPKKVCFLELLEKEELYHIGRREGKQGLQSSVGNQAGIKKLAIGTKTDTNGNDPGIINGTTAQIYRAGILPKENTETTKVRPKLLVEVNTGVKGEKFIHDSGKRSNKWRGKPERDKRRNKSTNI